MGYGRRISKYVFKDMVQCGETNTLTVNADGLTLATCPLAVTCRHVTAYITQQFSHFAEVNPGTFPLNRH